MPHARNYNWRNRVIRRISSLVKIIAGCPTRARLVRFIDNGGREEEKRGDKVHAGSVRIERSTLQPARNIFILVLLGNVVDPIE